MAGSSLLEDIWFLDVTAPRTGRFPRCWEDLANVLREVPGIGLTS